MNRSRPAFTRRSRSSPGRRDRRQQRVELGFVVRVAVDARARHHLRVVLAVTRDRQVRDHGEADGERLHAREAARVLDERVGRLHQRRHVVGPADDGAVRRAASSSARSLSSRPHTVIGWNSPLRPIASTVASTSPTPHEPATTSTARSRGSSPSAAPHRVAVDDGVAEPVADERPTGARVLAAAVGGGLRRELAHREVAVDAGVDPQGVDGEVGEEGDDRDPQRLLAAHAAEHERRQRVHRHDRVGTELLDRACGACGA